MEPKYYAEKAIGHPKSSAENMTGCLVPDLQANQTDGPEEVNDNSLRTPGKFAPENSWLEGIRSVPSFWGFFGLFSGA